MGKAHGPRSLFEGLSFGLFEGDQVGLVGPNGAGKSTLLRGHDLAGRVGEFDKRQRGSGSRIILVLEATVELDARELTVTKFAACRGRCRRRRTRAAALPAHHLQDLRLLDGHV